MQNIVYENIKELKDKFSMIKEKGWIKSKRKDFGGIGITFENLIGVNSNDLEIPDYNGIEIKTKRSYSKSYINLFNCVPTGPHYHEVERIKDKYGYPDSILKNYKVLNASVWATEKNKVGLFYYFKLKINRECQKIFLEVYNKNGKLIENFVYWDFDILEEKLLRKLKNLAFIKALVKHKNGNEYFKYYDMKIYKLKDFNCFIDLIEQGVIRINFKLSIFRKGNKIGKIHDHGTSFNIKECDLIKLYNLIQ